MSERFVWPPSLREFVSQENSHCLRLRQRALARGQGLLYGTGAVLVCMGVLIAVAGGASLSNMARALGCVLIGAAVSWRALKLSLSWMELGRTDGGWLVRQGVWQSTTREFHVRDQDIQGSEAAYDTVGWGFGLSAFKHVRVHLNVNHFEIADGYRMPDEAVAALRDLISYKSAEAKKNVGRKP